MTTNNENGAQPLTSWKKVYSAITHPWMIYAFFGVLGWASITCLENYLLVSSATTHWEWIEKIASKEAVMIIEISREETTSCILFFCFFGLVGSVFLVLFTIWIAKNFYRMEMIVYAVIAFLAAGWSSTIFTALTSDVAKSSKEAYKANLEMVFKELEAAPPGKFFVYDKTVYDGKTAAAILKKEFA